MRIMWDIRRSVEIGLYAYRALKRGENVVLNTTPGRPGLTGNTFVNCRGVQYLFSMGDAPPQEPAK